MVPSTTSDIRAIASRGGTVMVERVDKFPIRGEEFTMDAVCVVEVGSDGRITRWREYYDQQSITNQIEAAGIPIRTRPER